MSCGGFWKQQIKANNKEYTLGQGKGQYVARQEMERECTQLSCISENVPVKPTFIKDKNRHNLTTVTNYTMNLMKMQIIIKVTDQYNGLKLRDLLYRLHGILLVT